MSIQEHGNICKKAVIVNAPRWEQRTKHNLALITLLYHLYNKAIRSKMCWQTIVFIAKLVIMI